MDAHSLTVFNFTRLATHPDSDPPLPAPSLSSPALPAIQITQARNLIASSVATHDSGWRSVGIPGPQVLTFDLSNCYVYKNAPPSLGVAQSSEKDKPAIKDWGSPLATDELADPDALEEFVSTDLSTIFWATSSSEDEPTIDRKGKRKAPSPGMASKRAKLDFKLDPKKYHYYPYPLVKKPLDTKTLEERVPSFRKRLPVYLAPRTENDVKNYLEEPFATSAWLIPIRGRLPWSDASEGKMVGEDEAKEGDQPIVWTPMGLKRFWEFLINIHGQQQVGPISLSLHIAPESIANSTDDFGGVLNQDHIKVRHDACMALTIRTVLDVWKYEAAVGEDRGNGATKRRKIRPLRGAKLVLVDDCSEGLMVL